MTYTIICTKPTIKHVHSNTTAVLCIEATPTRNGPNVQTPAKKETQAVNASCAISLKDYMMWLSTSGMTIEMSTTGKSCVDEQYGESAAVHRGSDSERLPAG